MRYLPTTFEDLVNRARGGERPSLLEIRSTLEFWGVPVAGNFSLHWPAEGFVVDDQASEVFGSIVARLLADPRVSTTLRPENSSLSIHPSPETSVTEWADDKRVLNSKPYAKARRVSLYFIDGDPTVPRDTWIEQVGQGISLHYIG